MHEVLESRSDMLYTFMTVHFASGIYFLYVWNEIFPTCLQGNILIWELISQILFFCAFIQAFDSSVFRFLHHN